MIQRRIYLEKIAPFIGKPVIKVITGIRRCGKSTFLRMLVESLIEKGVNQRNILFINKDSLEFDFIADYKDLVNYVLQKFKSVRGEKYILLDEVQEIAGWEKAVAGFLADSVADVYITGSNSRMLSSELATLITGRYVLFTMYPLTFSEFLLFRKAGKGSDYEKEFDLFMKYGGFPGIHHMEYNDEVVEQYISSLYSTILLKDVVARNAIRDISLLERVAHFAADNCGNITSAKNITDFLKSQGRKGAVDTVSDYLGMLHSAYLFLKVNRFDIKGKRILEIHEKYYAGDIGLKNVLLGFRKNDIGGHLENIVFLELLSRGYTVHLGKLNGLEIDFIATKSYERLYIQVAYLLHDVKTTAREFGALEKIQDNYPKLVLSMDKFLDSSRNGIGWMNLVEFVNREPGAGSREP